MPSVIKHLYQFGEFTVDTDQKILMREGKPVQLTPKVFETLLILIENRGRIVEKNELMNRLWPDSFVEETNLTFNIKQLRKALGDDARNPVYIETIARRGYRFIASTEKILADTNLISGQFRVPFDTSDANEFQDEIPEPATEWIEQNYSTTLAKKPDTPLVSDSISAKVNKRSVAIAAALLVLLFGAGFIVWKFSKGLNNGSSESKRTDNKPSALLPLKLEKIAATGKNRLAAISPDGNYVVYTSEVKKQISIRLRELPSNTDIEIVQPQPNEYVYGLAFSHNGENLYFVRGDENAMTALFRVSRLGGVPTKIIDKLEGNFSISSDDNQIAFIRQVINKEGQREYSLMIANSDGSSERTLLVGAHPNSLDTPVWSPDGQAIICAFGNTHGGSQEISIVEIRVADGNKKELSHEKFSSIARMAWLSNKNELVITARSRFDDGNQLWKVSYSDGKVTKLTEGLASYNELSLTADGEKTVTSQVTLISDMWVGDKNTPQNLNRITQAMTAFSWTPSGQLIYTSDASGHRDIWIMNADGTEQKQLTASSAGKGGPFVTLDNRYVVFTSNQTGMSQVWRMNIDGSNQIPLTHVTSNGSALSPDGKWVFYNTVDNWNLWKISIDGGEPVRVTDYLALYPSVSPDGKMLACVGRNKSKREILILPVDGGQPLKKFGFGEWIISGWGGWGIKWTPDSKSLMYIAGRNGITSLLKQSLDGSSPEKMFDFGEDQIFDFGFSPDGKYLAVTRGGWQHDIVLINDFGKLK
jgi:Tol biopolymer transport system component/DNA-binding winged helix-turn-helix (wHTH) protein